MIERPVYTQEELEFIKEWGVPSDQEFDTHRLAYGGFSGKRITALGLAQERKKFLEAHGKTSDYVKNFE